MLQWRNTQRPRSKQRKQPQNLFEQVWNSYFSRIQHGYNGRRRVNHAVKIPIKIRLKYGRLIKGYDNAHVQI